MGDDSLWAAASRVLHTIDDQFVEARLRVEIAHVHSEIPVVGHPDSTVVVVGVISRVVVRALDAAV